MPDRTALLNSLTDSLKQALADTGTDLQKSADEVAQYALAESDKLVAVAGDPDFARAVVAARDAVALFAGIDATAEADAADARIAGLIHGAIAMAVTALAAA